MLEIIVSARLNYSEDASKVIHAIKNIIDAEVNIEDNKVIAMANKKEALRIIYKQARAREILGVLKKVLLDNLRDDKTWLYLNRQAAYAGVIVVCDDEKESPLGPIKVEIRSDSLHSFIDWLTRY
ncbi:MAG: RNA-binding domain-containing protein [Candidatus Nitrosocaldaceae archaeon]